MNLILNPYLVTKHQEIQTTFIPRHHTVPPSTQEFLHLKYNAAKLSLAELKKKNLVHLYI